MREIRALTGKGGQRRPPWRRAVAIATALPLVAGVLLGVLPPQNIDGAAAAVPAADSTHAVITVKVGSDRIANSAAVSGLAGVKLALFSGGGANTATPAQGSNGTRVSTTWTWANCTSDAAGDCSFVIPIRSGAISLTGAPQDTRFWVSQVPSGPGMLDNYYSNPQMRLGAFASTPDYTWDYRFRTGPLLRANTTYFSTAPMSAAIDYLDPDLGFMRNREASNAEGGYGANIGRSTGIWSQSRNNPVLPGKCGLRVALVTDTSGSLRNSVGGVPNDTVPNGLTTFQNAMSSFVDAFRGTPTTMSLFSFSQTSPGTGATNSPVPLPVTTAVQAATFKAQYASWTAGGGTNWDRGLAAAANSGNAYDLVVMLTDGNPTLMGANASSTASAYNAFQDVDAGIFSANQLKASGTRIIAIGAGPGLTTASEYNLRSISGTTKGTDYFRVTQLSDVEGVLADLAKTDCQGSVQVQKMIVPTNGTIAQATPAPAGWNFTAVSTEPTKVTVNAPASAATTAASNGTVNFGLTYANAITNGGIKINETQQAGYSLVPVSGQNAVCTNANTGASVPVTNDNSAAATPGFTVNSVVGTQIQCKIYNTIPPTPGNLVVTKSNTPGTGTVVSPGDTVTYKLTFTNTGGLPVAVDYTDYLNDVVDDSTWLNNMAVAGSGLTATRFLAPPTNKVTIVGTLAAGQTSTVTYGVAVKPGTTGDGTLRNLLGPTTGTPPTACVPGADPTWLCTVNPVKGSFSLVKSSVPATGTLVSPGDTVTYTVTAQGADGTVSGIVIKDDLTAVLNNATFVAGSAKLTIGSGTPITVPDPSGSNPILLQTAPFNLSTNQKAALTYQVTVNAEAWSKTLKNVVTGTSTGNVPPTSCAPCTTTHPTPAKLLIKKIGESGSAAWVAMDGSTWSVSNDNAGIKGTPYTGTGVTAVQPAATGTFQLQNIPAGTYWLTETTAPTGFSLLAEPVQFTIAANGTVTLGQGTGNGVVTVAQDSGFFMITVRDVPALKMPESGGPGTQIFLIGGSLILLTSLVLIVGQRRRRNRGVDMA